MIKRLNVDDAVFMFASVDKMIWWGEHQSVTRSALQLGNEMVHFTLFYHFSTAETSIFQ